ncbi:hypothetical protein GF314_04215 [bacterium]|nr:hypothetical protein [bacterium]
MRTFMCSSGIADSGWTLPSCNCDARADDAPGPREPRRWAVLEPRTAWRCAVRLGRWIDRWSISTLVAPASIRHGLVRSPGPGSPASRGDARPPKGMTLAGGCQSTGGSTSVGAPRRSAGAPRRAGGRLPALDLLRGLMLIVMTIDHLDHAGPIYHFTYEPLGYASAAEGFVLISGVVAGIVYTRHAERGELGKRLRRRLATLWAHHAVVVGGLFAYRWIWPDQRPAGGIEAALAAAVGGLILVNQQPPLDILPIYLVMVAFLPVVLGALRAGRAPWLLVASAGAWIVAQAPYVREIALPTLVIPVAGWRIVGHPNQFDLLAWQLLFVAGVWAGWRWHRGLPLPLRPASGRWWASAAAVAVVLMLVRHGVGLPELPLERPIVGRANLGPLRLVNIALLVWLLAQVVGRRPGLLRSPWVELLGRHALVVFVWHVGLQLFLRPWYLEAAGRWGIGARAVILVVALASLTVPAWAREHLRGRRRQRANPA